MEVLRRNPKFVKFLIDIICILCLIGLLFVNLIPGKTGFACNDSSIRKAKRTSSISTNAVFTWGYVIPVIIIISIESLAFLSRWKRSSTHRNLMAEYFWILWNELLTFFFGAIVQQLLTNVAKGTMGQLRPTFFATCQPRNYVCTDAASFVSEYSCLNESEEELADARSSFFSSHASFVFYIAMYMNLYLQHRIRWQSFSLYLPVAQLSFLAVAVYVSLTRMTDHKHHAIDVTFGVFNGLGIALFVSLVHRKRVLREITSRQSSI